MSSNCQWQTRIAVDFADILSAYTFYALRSLLTTLYSEFAAMQHLIVGIGSQTR